MTTTNKSKELSDLEKALQTTSGSQALDTFLGERYDEQGGLNEDMLSAMKIASKQFLDNATKLETVSSELDDLKSKTTVTPHAQKIQDFVKQAFPQVNSCDSGLSMITHLIAHDQFQPNSWLNYTTRNNNANKLDLLEAIIKQARKSGDA